ncbi:GAF and ANTAR domain-containing protein [Actinoplanes utahensis]|uniref:Transcriptional regulator n=1 Tax=Actinoplanes utahensis TaxID=1869 RepID=A0A0A6UEU8_ACTUT|nr:GAF and ANTAR domain-containing protein [Actinoplanes utahensis]KHD74575.1 transcriptional regulator [Actinoplanes utahensis]GIF35358.1 transcriptional regulator [Actinoplanes utahensis]
MSTVSPHRLATMFVEVADTNSPDFDVVEFLQMFADHIAELVPEATAGTLLADQQGRLHYTAASDETTKLLELLQLQEQDGPCVDAFHQRELVISTDLHSAAERWPQFAPHASAVGFRSVHAFPLQLRDQAIGALGVFSTTAGRFDDTEVHIVQSVADVATISLLYHRSIKHADGLTRQLQSALNSRVLIEQAKGAIAHAHNISVDEAFNLLRAYARHTNQRLQHVASQAVTEPHSLPGPASHT